MPNELAVAIVFSLCTRRNKETNQNNAYCCRGYYVCLARDGKVYDDSKYSWLQGKQVGHSTLKLTDCHILQKTKLTIFHINQTLSSRYGCIQSFTMNLQNTAT